MRRSGRTTRLIDKYVQELFTKGRVIVEDHHDSLQSHYRLRNLIINRLKNEHPGVKLDWASKRISLIKSAEKQLAEELDNFLSTSFFTTKLPPDFTITYAFSRFDEISGEGEKITYHHPSGMKFRIVRK